MRILIEEQITVGYLPYDEKKFGTLIDRGILQVDGDEIIIPKGTLGFATKCKLGDYRTFVIDGCDVEFNIDCVGYKNFEVSWLSNWRTYKRTVLAKNGLNATRIAVQNFRCDMNHLTVREIKC